VSVEEAVHAASSSITSVIAPCDRTAAVSRLFRTAAPYYARYRPGYPPELIAALVEATAIGPESRVLDLGCGPGTVAIPVAAYAGEVVAVDTEPEMIAEVRGAAPPNVTVVEGRAEDVDESWGAFALATAGRAFHWFDAPLVFGRLAGITPVVALLADDTRDSHAQSLALAIAAELTGGPEYDRPKPRYAELLAASAFSDIEVLTVVAERTWTPEELIGLVYSTSSGSPERLGERQQEFEQRVRRELEPSYRERIAVDAVVGRQARVAGT
jgi:SAM-dependent methyltransferase